MKVVVDALPLRHGGGVTYLEQQLAALARVAPDLELHTLVSPWAQIGELPGTTETIRVRSVFARFVYEQVGLARREFDVLYRPANFGPICGKRPMVLTLQNAHYYRAGLQLKETKHLRPWWKVKANHLAMKRANAVVAISRSEAADAIATVPDIEKRLHVIHSATPVWPVEPIRPPGLPDRYILTVANSATHKRTVDVVKGWARSLDRNSAQLPLVVIGSTTTAQRRSFTTLAGRYASMLHLVGPVRERSKMRWAYENASALVSMSLLEAFPLTPVEAASLGCPLILSDIPSHREVSQGQSQFIRTGDTAHLASLLAEWSAMEDAGRSPVAWPVTWDDNAQSLARVIRATSMSCRPVPREAGQEAKHA